MRHNFTKFPILILSAPRTGSTVLSKYIKNKSDIPLEFFMEPTTGNWAPDKLDWQTNNVMEDFNRAFDNTDKIIVKDHIHTFKKHLPKNIEYLLSDKTFKIRLRRRDFIEQIASRYIVWYRKEWHYNKDTVDSIKYEVAINSEIILKIAMIFKDINTELDNVQIKFDLDLYYEDIILDYDLEISSLVPTPKPSNYQELLEIIRHEVKKI